MTDEQMYDLSLKGIDPKEISRQSGKTPHAVIARIKRVKAEKELETRNVFDNMFNQIFCKKLGAK